MELKGQRFGKLICLMIVGKDKSRCNIWLCKCDCGKEVSVRSNSLLTGNTRSCGCLQKEKTSEFNKSRSKHNSCYTRVYRIWAHMKERCLNPNCKDYKHYGGRGIEIFPEWMGFGPFHEWATNNGYKNNLTIERVNVNGNYEPRNCTWIPRSEQPKNRRKRIPA